MQSFELDPGIRRSDYDTIGGVTTYKLLADWVVNDAVRVRGGHQVANRAPNVTELFTPLGGSVLAFGGVTDACAYYPNNTQSGQQARESEPAQRADALPVLDDPRGRPGIALCAGPS